MSLFISVDTCELSCGTACSSTCHKNQRGGGAVENPRGTLETCMLVWQHVYGPAFPAHFTAVLSYLLCLVPSWYHCDLSRHAAEALLLSNGKDGSYLLRNSNDGPGCYALSVRLVITLKDTNTSWVFLG